MMWFFTHADTAAGSVVIAGVYVKQTKEVFQLTWGIKRSAITSKYLQKYSPGTFCMWLPNLKVMTSCVPMRETKSFGFVNRKNK